MATRTETLRLEIDGEQVKNSYDDLQKAQKQLARELKGMEKGTDEYIKKSQQLNQVNKRLEQVKGDINKVGNEWKKQQTLWQSAKATMIGTFAGLGIAALAQQALSMGKQIIDFVKQLTAERKEVTRLTGATGEYLDIVTSKVQSLADTFKADFREVLVASNAFAKSMGIDQVAALDLVQKGFAAGADASGEFLAILKEYGPQFKAAGLSAEQSIKLIQTQVKEGIYSDKGIDVIKEATLRIREMPKATEDAINAIGLSGREISDQLKAGTITVFDAIQMVSRRMAELPPQSREVGTAIADIFGGPGEDAGLEYIKLLGNVDTAMSDVEETTYNLIKANEAYNKSLNDLFGDGSAWQSLYTKGLNAVAAGLQNVADFTNAETVPAWRKWLAVLMPLSGELSNITKEGQIQRELETLVATQKAKKIDQLETEKKLLTEIRELETQKAKDAQAIAEQQSLMSTLVGGTSEVEQLQSNLKTVELSYTEMEEAITAKNKQLSDMRRHMNAQELAEREAANEAMIEMAFSSGSAAVESAETIKGAGKGVLNSLRSQLKGLYSEFIGRIVLSAVRDIPFPFNLAAAAAAGGIASLLFNKVVPSFYHGGPTPSASIGMGDQNGPYTGFTHGNEFVLSAAHRRDPVVANTERYIESTRRYGSAGVAGAGAAAPLSVNASASLDAQQFQQAVGMFTQWVGVLQSRPLKADFSGKAFEDGKEYYDKKETNRNRGRII